jgi:hypothetical protein
MIARDWDGTRLPPPTPVPGLDVWLCSVLPMSDKIDCVASIIIVTHCHHYTDQAFLLITVGGRG